MIGYVAAECQWNSRTLVSESFLSDSTQSPISPRIISLHLCKLDNDSRIGLSSHSGLPGEDQPFLLLVIDSDSGVASKLLHREQEAIPLAAIRKLHRVPLWEAEGAELWMWCPRLCRGLEATARLEIRIKHQNGIANNCHHRDSMLSMLATG
ncbi:hypothetical protein BGY98DRAFT_936365 [Russula aff. rugulosa BPL654]|nr:hypothetical protein BGY98DRAFT_936365 [Russula aff. rugulosa BPL654]